MKKIVSKRIMSVLLGILFTVIAVVGGYVAYLSIQYYRIDDYTEVTAENQSENILTSTEEHSVVTYNIGFGAYNQEFSFFMDSGEMADGTVMTGTSAKAKDKETVIEDTKGSISLVDEYNADFYLFQEVDVDSTRSYGVNQYEMLKELGDEYSLSHGVNFHSAYLMYPLTDPHGASNSGMTTVSKYKINESIRRQYPIDDSFITKFTDLDRCFLVSRIPVDNGKELVLINNHMSAYDKGGLIRAEQMKLLNSVLEEEYEKGNYVIVGGDFNHDIANSRETFSSAQSLPTWVYQLNDSDLSNGYSFAIAENSTEVPTCRSAEIPYVKGENYTVIIDGFIVSDNIKDFKVENIDTDFKYSDHNPAIMYFTLD